jgi:hypothetical protein
MLKCPPPPVNMTVPGIGVFGPQAEMGVDDGSPSTNRRYFLNEFHHVRRVQVIEYSEAEHDIKLPILCRA